MLPAAMLRIIRYCVYRYNALSFYGITKERHCRADGCIIKINNAMNWYYVMMLWYDTSSS